MIEFENVGMRYGGGPEILHDVSFTLEEGAFAFLTGASGAGKTTLLKLMYLGLRPTRGLIRMFGHDMATLPRGQIPAIRRRIGVVFQDFRLLDHLTTFENVALPLFVDGQKPGQYADDVMELLAWVGLGDHANAYPEVLSGGEKQRAAIARAIVGKPEILLADEPTGNVDPQLARRLMRLFSALNEQGTTVVIATHDMQIVKDTPRARRMHLDAGRLSMDAGGLAA